MSPPGATIRPYRDDDRQTLENLIIEMQDYERALDPRLLPGRLMATAYADEMLGRCRDEDGRVFVATVDGAVVAFITVLSRVPVTELDQPPGSYALISDLLVTAGARSRGIGRALLDTATDFARERAATDLRIAVLADNVVADRLYRASGFEPYLLIHSRRL